MAGISNRDGAEESREELNQRLHDAALAGDVVKLREAIAAGADVDARLPSHEVGYKSQTPLCAVVCAAEINRNRAEKGRTACVRALLDAGASASAAVILRDNEEPGYTAMHDAAWAGLDTICRLLLDAGADLTAICDGNGFTPLRYAAIHRHHRLVVLLLSRGATTDGSPLDQISPGYHSRISSAGSFANYQKQQRATLMAMLAPKFTHLLPPELVSHVITFWGHLGWK